MFHIKKRVKEIDEQLAAKRKETQDKMAEVGLSLLPPVWCAFLCLAYHLLMLVDGTRFELALHVPWRQRRLRGLLCGARLQLQPMHVLPNVQRKLGELVQVLARELVLARDLELLGLWGMQCTLQLQPTTHMGGWSSWMQRPGTCTTITPPWRWPSGTRRQSWLARRTLGRRRLQKTTRATCTKQSNGCLQTCSSKSSDAQQRCRPLWTN